MQILHFHQQKWWEPTKSASLFDCDYPSDEPFRHFAEYLEEHTGNPGMKWNERQSDGPVFMYDGHK